MKKFEIRVLYNGKQIDRYVTVGNDPFYVELNEAEARKRDITVQAIEIEDEKPKR